MYLEDDFVDVENPFEVEDKERKAHGADHLSLIYDILSGAKPFDVRELYNSLEEVGSSLDWDIPYKPEHEDYLHSLIL